MLSSFIFTDMENAVQNNLEQIRVAIQREFIERCRKNPAYSLRAFAKYLDINQSFLSKLLKGQRPVTADLAASVGPRLGLKPTQVKALFSSGTTSMPGFLSLSDDEFELLSEWHHFAIIELSKTDDFDNDPQKIANRVGIHVEEVRDAVERLQRLNFIQVKNGVFKVLSPNTTWTNTKKTSEARKKFQKTLLEKSVDSIDHVPFEQRDNGSVTLAINTKRLPEFKEKLKDMRKEIADFFQADDEKNLDEVYQLTVSFFPLSKIENKKTGERK
jgi:DNA-binding transcriptional regulator YhcF (GntR family)